MDGLRRKMPIERHRSRLVFFGEELQIPRSGIGWTTRMRGATCSRTTRKKGNNQIGVVEYILSCWILESEGCAALFKTAI